MTGAGVSYAATFGGGLISFVSPCVLPIVPAYLSVITGLDVTEAAKGSRRHLGRVARDTSLFVAGFSAVFILLGLSATTIGHALFADHVLITRISGLAVLAMALFIAGSLILRAPWLYAEHRFHPSPTFRPVRRAGGRRRLRPRQHHRRRDPRRAAATADPRDGRRRPVVVWQVPGTASALSDSTIAGGPDVGATGVFDPIFDGRVLHFEAQAGGFRDHETGTTWDVLGRGVSSPDADRRLTAVLHVETFSFAWATFRPTTRIISS